MEEVIKVLLFVTDPLPLMKISSRLSKDLSSSLITAIGIGA